MKIHEVHFLPDARLDLIEVYSRYEGKSPGLGSEFFRCVEAVESQLIHHPLSFQFYMPPWRRASIRRFPYGVYYRMKDEAVYVVAVLHMKRSEESVEKRLV